MVDPPGQSSVHIQNVHVFNIPIGLVSHGCFVDGFIIKYMYIKNSFLCVYLPTTIRFDLKFFFIPAIFSGSDRGQKQKSGQTIRLVFLFLSLARCLQSTQ